MPTYIKAGLWKKAKKALEGELNLTSLIQSLIPPPVPPEATYKVYTAVFSKTFSSDPPSFTVLENTIGEGITIESHYTALNNVLINVNGLIDVNSPKTTITYKYINNVFAKFTPFLGNFLFSHNGLVYNQTATPEGPKPIGFASTNQSFENVFLEIRVYN